MNKMYIIPDLSHHNTDNAVAMEYLKYNTAPYLILKLTEGSTYTDPKATDLIKTFLARHIERGVFGVTIGLYHFCRLDNKTSMQTSVERAEEEMRHFTSAIKYISTYINACFENFIRVDYVAILDYEGDSLTKSNRSEYLQKCVAMCYKEFNVAPVIYCSASVTKNKEMVDLKRAYPDVPLWVAHYNKKKPDVFTWRDWLAWQFTSVPFDLSFVRDSFEGYAFKL